MVKTEDFDSDTIYKILEEVKDPEVPVLSVIDLGVVRNVEISGNHATIDITPTYSGCPAMQVIEDDIKKILISYGFKKVIVNTVFSPAWTTDWISDKGLAQLEAYGIAPPEKNSIDKGSLFQKEKKIVKCPLCKSSNTEITSQFGSTACKALYKCLDCLEPFDYFKCI